MNAKPASAPPNNRSLTRIVLFAILVGLQLLYFPINRMVDGGISTYLPIDNYIKLSEIWAIPYLLSLPWWIAALIWATRKMEYERFIHLFLCLALTILLSYVIYILFPTHVDRPEITKEDWLSQLVRFIYGNDRPYNALPSGHTYTTLIIAIFWFHWHPKQRVLWALIAAVIILSTLFTKQHAILDLLAAAALTALCYKLSQPLTRKYLRAFSAA